MTDPRVWLVAEGGTGWFIPYAERLAERIGPRATVVGSYDDIEPDGVAFFLSCTQVASPEVLGRSRHSLVVHQSDLPAGRGWSPLAHQVLEGKRRIPVSLFEAVAGLDEGPVYYRDTIELEGHELVDELRAKQAASAMKLALRFLDAYPNVRATPQTGEPSYYPRRRPEDCRLDVTRPIEEQFELLRICDPEHYPAFFELRGHRYEVLVRKASAPSVESEP
jgi:methionyl-tRNA formyltransferase